MSPACPAVTLSATWSSVWPPTTIATMRVVEAGRFSIGTLNSTDNAKKIPSSTRLGNRPSAITWPATPRKNQTEAIVSARAHSTAASTRSSTARFSHATCGHHPAAVDQGSSCACGAALGAHHLGSC